MIDVADLAAAIEPLSPEKQVRVLHTYRYQNLSVHNRFRVLLSKLPESERMAVFEELPPDAIVALTREWRYNARPDQLAPSWLWRTWVNCAGRGCGKSISGLNWIADSAVETIGDYLVAGKSDSETREKMFLPILALLKDRGIDLGKKGSVDKRDGIARLPNGSTIYSGAGTTLQDNVRGANLSGAHLDELCVWADPMEAYKQTRLAVRKGRSQVYISTTPLVSGAANQLLTELIKQPGTHYTVTNAYSNLENLAAGHILTLLADEGKRIAEEEIWANILSDAGALFSQSLFEDTADFQFHFQKEPPIESFDRIVVAYDPAIKERVGDEHGIMVIGMKRQMHAPSRQRLPHFWVLADFTDQYSPAAAAEMLSKLYHRYSADAVVVETNNGGDWIPTVIRSVDAKVHIKEVTATRGKAIRAEPIVGLYEQRRVRHHSHMGKLEDEYITLTPDTRVSPNRADAAVWGLTELDEELESGPRKLDLWLGY